MNTESRDSGQQTTWRDARAAYRLAEPPEALEAMLLARFGEQRALQRQVADAPRLTAPPMQPSRWRRLLSQARLHPALAGGLSLCVALAFAAPWWSQSLMAAPEYSTPFLLVGEPEGGRIEVAQMVRVNVVREAMVDFGFPVPPQQMQEPVRAEMLLGLRGELLAVRFIDAPARKRWRFD